MKYILDNNVYLVRGSVKSCIYNLNTRCLFRVNHETIDLLSNFSKSKITKENEDAIKKLVEFRVYVQKNEVSEKLNREEPHIDFAWIELTNRCNFKCIHCYHGKKEQKDISFDELIKLLNQLHEAGIKSIQFIGGEPFLFNRILDAVKYARKIFKNITIFTNGSLLNDRHLEWFSQNHINLAISLYGCNALEFKRITCTDGFDKVKSNIEIIKSKGIKLHLCAVKLKGYANDYPKGVKVDLPRLTGKASGKMYTKEMLYDKIITSERFEYPLNKKQVLANMQYNKCFCRKVYIDRNLDVYPCPMERRVMHGSLRGGTSLKDIIKDSILMLNNDKVGECNFCEYRYACNTCLPDSNGKKIFEKPWYCTYLPMEGRWEAKEEILKRLAL